LFADKWTTHLQDMPFLWKVKYVHYPPNCTRMSPSTRIGYAWMLRTMLTAVLNHLYKTRLPYMEFLLMTCVIIMRVPAAMGRRKLSQSLCSYKTVKSFLYAHSIGRHDKYNILNLVLVLCHLKCKVSK
jgi:hypothetical protein